MQDEPLVAEQALDTADATDDDILTAVLLIRNRSGDVRPVTLIENIKMAHQAKSQDVFSMCADVLVPTAKKPKVQRATADSATSVCLTRVYDDIVTAVLLIRSRSGAAHPVTLLENIKMVHQANPYDVFLMCAEMLAD